MLEQWKEFWRRLGICDWFKKNMILGIILVVVALVMLFPKQLRRIFRTTRPRRRRRIRPAAAARPRRRTRSGRPLPRSVGMRKRAVATIARRYKKPTGKGYPAAGGGTIPYKYNKDGTVKKAWQVGGTVAAKRRMAALRKTR